MRKKIQNTDLTDLQRKKIIEPYIGNRVLWQGWAEEVKEKGNGYVVCVDMDKPEIVFSVYDLTIPVSETLALKINKDQIVYIAGTIKSIDMIMGTFSVELTNPKLSTQKP